MAKRLFRDRNNKMVAGVCAGLGNYFDIDPTIIRLAWVLFCFMAGGGVIAYIIGMIVIPYGPDGYIEKQ